jgi:hypothetical protein
VNQIACKTPPHAQSNSPISVVVDGVHTAKCSGSCYFYYRDYYSPRLDHLSKSSALEGDVVTIKGYIPGSSIFVENLLPTDELAQLIVKVNDPLIKTCTTLPAPSHAL